MIVFISGIHYAFFVVRYINFNPKKISLPLMQVREGNLVDVIADLEDTLLAPNLISGTNAVGH